MKMTRERAHPECIKYRAIGMFEAGMKSRAISRKLRVPNSSVCFWINKFLKQGNVDRPKIPTRPRKTIATADRRLMCLCKAGRFSSASQLLGEFVLTLQSALLRITTFVISQMSKKIFRTLYVSQKFRAFASLISVRNGNLPVYGIFMALFPHVLVEKVSKILNTRTSNFIKISLIPQ